MEYVMTPKRQLYYVLVLLFALATADHSARTSLPRPRLFGQPSARNVEYSTLLHLRGGGWLIPAGWNPFGYKITSLGEDFLAFEGSRDCDVGRFISSLKARRSRKATIKDSWREIVRASKTGQAMRIYRLVDELINFCIKAGLID